MATYTAKVRREGRGWTVHLPQIDRQVQVRRLDDAADAARECIAATGDLDPKDIDVVVEREA